jgi:hypothetical protein
MTDTAIGQTAETEPAWMVQARGKFAQWLDEMDDLDAARMLQMLTTHPHPRWLGELRAAKVFRLSREHEYKTLAAQLAVSRDAINKAVTAHNRRSASPAQ